MSQDIIESEMEVGMATCKYCKVGDQKAQMHKDKYTKEYYHEWCRPIPKNWKN